MGCRERDRCPGCGPAAELHHDENGHPIAMLEINRDITARKIAEAAAKDYSTRLERTNQELRDFASIASHDLQEPLRKVSTFGSILEAKFADALGKEGQAYLAKMLDATARMQALIQSLLIYSRVATRSEPFVSVDLGKLVKEVLLDLEIPLQETGAEVGTDDLPRIEADPGQIRQLFQNLIGNALKFHGDNPRIKIYAEACWEGTCKIYIEDNGIGFDELYLDRIFQPFQRLHGKSSPYKGSGIGLAICRKIVDRHNGTITARSVQGKEQKMSLNKGLRSGLLNSWPQTRGSRESIGIFRNFYSSPLTIFRSRSERSKSLTIE